MNKHTYIEAVKHTMLLQNVSEATSRVVRFMRGKQEVRQALPVVVTAVATAVGVGVVLIVAHWKELSFMTKACAHEIYIHMYVYASKCNIRVYPASSVAVAGGGGSA